jgi:hypothetical protein
MLLLPPPHQLDQGFLGVQAAEDIRSTTFIAGNQALKLRARRHRSSKKRAVTQRERTCGALQRRGAGQTRAVSM